LKSPFHAECAIEALGKIGCAEAYGAILANLSEHPEFAAISLLPLARTGREKSVRYLRHYLSSERAALRQAAIGALACVASGESLQALKEQLCVEQNEEVRASLLSAVHSLQSMLVHDLEFPNMDSFHFPPYAEHHGGS